MRVGTGQGDRGEHRSGAKPKLVVEYTEEATSSCQKCQSLDSTLASARSDRLYNVGFISFTYMFSLPISQWYSSYQAAKMGFFFFFAFSFLFLYHLSFKFDFLY